MSELLSQVGRRVRERRKEKAMTLKELARAAGLSERFVSELEAGRANISVMNLAEVAQALQLPLGAFFVAADRGAQEGGVIALLGLRGAGKSTVGKALAVRLAVPFFELDRLVEAEAGMSLAEIFAIHGEAYFRALELRALERFLDGHRRGVLATGGGLVTSPDAYRLLRERTRTVWLKARPAEHWARVVGQGDLRPMQNRPQARAELERRLREREPLYKKAERVVNTSGRAVNDVVHELLR
ncbi:MAG: helix-turn-helix domain-containing protein [Archangiaceae bacterium]|nr:helix-turn-helix domain-containing protein [Archangiaceae bacterium]